MREDSSSVVVTMVEEAKGGEEEKGLMRVYKTSQSAPRASRFTPKSYCVKRLFEGFNLIGCCPFCVGSAIMGQSISAHCSWIVSLDCCCCWMSVLIFHMLYILQLCFGRVLILGPKAGYKMYNMANADMTFGVISLGCGLGGTIAGGLVLDYVTSTISNAFKDHIHCWRKTTLILTSILFLSVAFWFVGIFLHGKDKFYDESKHIVSKSRKGKKEKMGTA